MMPGRHVYRYGLQAILVVLLSLLVSGSAYASLTGYVARGSDGKYFEYQYNELLDSYIMKSLGSNGKVFEHFRKHKMHAYLIGTEGYVDYNDVIDAYITATLSGRSFNFNSYTSSSKAKKASMPNEVYLVSLDSRGNIKTTKKVLVEPEPPPEEPEPAPITVTEALKAVNDARTVSAMKKALSDHDKVLKLNLSGYKLTSSERDNLASYLLNLKPFSSAVSLRRILHTGVISVRAGVEIAHTGYDYTMKKMVDIQMGVNPQTDLYGGGWKSAKREDVEHYVNPYNFISMEYDGSELKSVRINVNGLRVRSRPSTQGTVLGNVNSGDLFVYKGEAKGEQGTASGTEGTWYKIIYEGKEGWVYGGYASLVQETLPSSMFQFLILSGSAGSTVTDLNKILKNRGILDGTGKVFMDAAKENNINEIFLVSLALHESGNGTSKLATGIEVEDKDNLFPDKDFVTVYNMFGIGAYDSNPNLHGSQYAYSKRWFTPEEAIIGGAEFASKQYVNHSSYRQDTLYKMRWNPGKPGVHQYATDIGWAAKQVGRIKNLYDQCSTYTLKFDIPRYK